MNEVVLNQFRAIAEVMAGPEPRDWQWIGPWMSQRMFGITEKRAKEYTARHGGKAKQMEPEAGNPVAEKHKAKIAAADEKMPGAIRSMMSR